MTEVVFLLAPRLHLLDLAGPAQAFSAAADLGADYRLHYVGEQEDVATTQGVPLRARLDWPDLGENGLIVVPGWRRPRRTAYSGFSEPTLERLRAHHGLGGTVASVCAGAFALARAGLLDGRRCTTHHDLQDEPARHFASGIDLALHLLAAWHGPSFAAQVAREMVVYARRNGDEQQAAVGLGRPHTAQPPRRYPMTRHALDSAERSRWLIRPPAPLAPSSTPIWDGGPAPSSAGARLRGR